MKNEAYAVTVNYDQDVYDAIKRGEYHGYPEDIIYDDCLPSSVRFDQPYFGRGTAQLEIVLVQFDREIEGLHEVRRELDKIGLRPATLKELLALGIQYPEVWQMRRVYALGSVWRFPWRFSNGSYVPILDGDSDGRCRLDLESFDWAYCGYYYAAVRK